MDLYGVHDEAVADHRDDQLGAPVTAAWDGIMLRSTYGSALTLSTSEMTSADNRR